MNILFIAPLPKPVTGQSVACKLLYAVLAQSNDGKCVNFNKSIDKNTGELLRVWQLLKLALKTIVWMPKANIVSYNPSEYVASGLKVCVLFIFIL